MKRVPLLIPVLQILGDDSLKLKAMAIAVGIPGVGQKTCD